MTHRTAVICAGVILQPLVWFGFGKRFPWARFGLEGVGLWVWTVISLAFLGWVVALLVRRAESSEAPAWLDRIVVVLILATAPLTLAFDFVAASHFARFGYRTPWLAVPVVAGVFGALLWWVRRGRPLGAGAWIATVGCAAHRLAVLQPFPIVESRSDMLPMIRSAIELAAAGASPYADQSASTTNGFMPYLPGTWLVHWPGVALGVDMRWVGTIALVAAGAWVALRVRSRFVEGFAVIVLLSPYHAFRHDLYFETFLVLTAGLFYLASREKNPGWGGVMGIGALLGLAIASRQWAWVYAPFLLLAISRSGAERPHLGRMVTGVVTATTTAVLVALPWILRDPSLFRRAITHHVGLPSTDLTLGLSGALIAMGWRDVLIPAQVVACIALFAIAVVRARRPGTRPMSITALGWLALLLVIALNQYLDVYFYLSASFAAVGIALAGNGQMGTAGDAGSFGMRGRSSLRSADRLLGVPLLWLLGVGSRRAMPARPERIGILRTAAIGDTLLLSGILNDLSEHFPDAELVLVTGEQNADAGGLAAYGAARPLIIPVANPARALAALRRERFDILIDTGSWPRLDALLTALSGARFRIGFETRGQHRHFAYDRMVRHSDAVHETDNFRALVRAAGVESAREPALAREALPPAPLVHSSRFVLFHPWAGGYRGDLREWPTEHWVELSHTLREACDHFVVTGGREDVGRSESLVHELRASGVSAESVAGGLTLGQVGALCAAGIGLVSVNTGVMHLGALLGVPTIGLNGPTATHRWGPLGPHARAIASTLPGCGFLNLGFEYAGQRHDCMQGIAASDVAVAFLDVIEGSKTHPAGRD